MSPQKVHYLAWDAEGFCTKEFAWTSETPQEELNAMMWERNAMNHQANLIVVGKNIEIKKIDPYATYEFYSVAEDYIFEFDARAIHAEKTVDDMDAVYFQSFTHKTTRVEVGVIPVKENK